MQPAVVLYDVGMVVGNEGKIAQRLDKVWLQMVGDAMQVGNANKWWGGEPMVSQRSLQWHGHICHGVCKGG